MGKQIAIVTGASGGLGKAFVEQMLDEGPDEIWCVARSTDKLQALRQEYGCKIIPVPMDLSQPDSLTQLTKRLEEARVSIAYLINNAGVGETLAPYHAFSTQQISQLIAVNCTAVASLCTLCLPFMARGSKILNIASQSAFQPVPYLNLYASSKAFARSYTRALNVELQDTGITATAVCPGWVQTDMLAYERNGQPVKYPGLAQAGDVARKAVRDAKRNRDISVYGGYVKYMHLLAKLLPQKTIMKTWTRQIRRYL